MDEAEDFFDSLPPVKMNDNVGEDWSYAIEVQSYIFGYPF